MEITITLPCAVSDLERTLHNVCDNRGCWDTATVTAEGNKLIINSNKGEIRNEH